MADIHIPYGDLSFGEQIGSGGFSTVHKGTCRGISVAIKLLKRKYVPEKLLQLFTKEIEVMESLRHPNVLNYFGVCLEGDNFMVITEIMDTDLCTYLFERSQGNKAFKPLTFYDRGKIAQHVALGCYWMHSNSILHRDLKSANILLKKSTLDVKICDFGLSHIINDDFVKDKGGPRGTLSWMAPEVLGKENFNEKSDVWSFGVVLWELFKFPYDLPHRGLAREEVIELVAVQKKSPPLPEYIAKDGSKLRKMFDACFQPEIKDRSSFKELTDLFEDLLIDLAIEDSDGRVFWQETFGKIEIVTWKAFWDGLEAFIPQSDKANVLGYKSLQHLLKNSKLDEGEVSLHDFANLLKFFQFLPDYKHSFVGSISKQCAEPYYHGKISGSTAAALLSGQPSGTFLIRFSSSNEVCYTLSMQTTDSPSPPRVTHVRLPLDTSTGEVLYEGNRFASLGDFVKQHPAFLRKPCPGSIFLTDDDAVDCYKPEF